jgi:hypothetical protein
VASVGDALRNGLKSAMTFDFVLKMLSDDINFLIYMGDSRDGAYQPVANGTDIFLPIPVGPSAGPGNHSTPGSGTGSSSTGSSNSSSSGSGGHSGVSPTFNPSAIPSTTPTAAPTTVPSAAPTTALSDAPSQSMSVILSATPSYAHSDAPTEAPPELPLPVPIVAVPQASAVANSDHDNGFVLGLAVGVPLAAALLLGAFLFQKKKLGLMTASRARGVDGSSGYVLVGTGDPPGSFHEGLYHYMRDGTRFLSTKCEHCFETRENMFYTDNNLATIMEDEVYQETVIAPDSKALASKYSGVDVHKCSSATCERCNAPKECEFLPSTSFFHSYDEEGFVHHSLFTEIEETAKLSRSSRQTRVDEAEV